MKNNLKLVLVCFLLSVLLFSFASADVGLGVSPSKMKEQLIAGSEYHYEILVFNTGSDTMDITLVPEGDLVGFTTIEPQTISVEPEPVPHELPIKNGQYFKVTFDLPSYGNKEKVFKGTLSAVGSKSSDSNFGGSVGVSTQVELVVSPAKSVFSKVRPIYYIILGAILALVILIWVLRKAGLKISFGDNSKKKKKK